MLCANVILTILDIDYGCISDILSCASLGFNSRGFITVKNLQISLRINDLLGISIGIPYVSYIGNLGF